VTTCNGVTLPPGTGIRVWDSTAETRFIVLPLRIFLYSLARTPELLIALQALDGIGAGIYGVAVVAMCADLTRGKGRFNALTGLIATALSVGGVIGPLGSGFLVQHLGFNVAFYVFAGIAAGLLANV